MTRARATLLLVLLTAPAAAQQDTLAARDTLRFRLQPVAVTVLRGTAVDLRVPAAVTPVGKTTIQDAQLTFGLDEALAAVPGVLVNNRYNFSLGTRIAIRGSGARAGFGVRGIRLLQDGIPLTMPDGQASVNNIDLGSAGRIEVLRGPASSLYGNAAGGVVAIETEPAPNTGFAGELRTLGGDNWSDGITRFNKHQLKVGGRGGKADYLVSASRLETDGFRTHSRAEQTVVNSRIGFKLSDAGRATLLFNLADAPTAQNPGSLPLDSVRKNPDMAWPNNVRQGTGEAAKQIQAGLGYDHRTGNGAFAVNVYGLTRELENPLPTTFISLDRKGGGARAAYSHNAALAGRALGFTIGADVEHQSDNRVEHNNVLGAKGTTLTRDQTDQVTSVGPFVQAQIALTPRIDLSLGLRYDRVRFETEDRFTGDQNDNSGDRTLSAVSPRAALLFALSDAASVYASVGTAFQTPTTTELINRLDDSGQPAAGFNQSLEPQRAVNFEAGIKGHAGGRIRYEASVYQMTVRDPVLQYLVVEGRDFYRNSGEIRHRGFELAGAAAVHSRILIETAYTFSDFVFVDDGVATNSFEGNELPGVAPHHLFTRLRFQPADWLALELEDEYTAEFFANDANTASNPSANVVDARAHFDVSTGRVSLRPFIGINNLFDKTYNSSVVVNQAQGRFYESAPGRNFYIGTSVRFGAW